LRVRLHASFYHKGKFIAGWWRYIEMQHPPQLGMEIDNTRVEELYYDSHTGEYMTYEIHRGHEDHDLCELEEHMLKYENSKRWTGGRE